MNAKLSEVEMWSYSTETAFDSTQADRRGRFETASLDQFPFLSKSLAGGAFWLTPEFLLINAGKNI